MRRRFRFRQRVREGQGEDGTGSIGAHVRLAAVRAHDRAGDRQPEADAVGKALARTVDAVEAVEQAWQVLGALLCLVLAATLPIGSVVGGLIVLAVGVLWRLLSRRALR